MNKKSSRNEVPNFSPELDIISNNLILIRQTFYPLFCLKQPDDWCLNHFLLTVSTIKIQKN